MSVKHTVKYLNLKTQWRGKCSVNRFVLVLYSSWLPQGTFYKTRRWLSCRLNVGIKGFLKKRTQGQAFYGKVFLWPWYQGTHGDLNQRREQTQSPEQTLQLWSVILSWIENSGKWITLCEVLELQTLEKKLNYLIYPFLGHRLQNPSPSPLESLFKNFLKQRTFPTYLGRAFCNLIYFQFLYYFQNIL